MSRKHPLADRPPLGRYAAVAVVFIAITAVSAQAQRPRSPFTADLPARSATRQKLPAESTIPSTATPPQITPREMGLVLSSEGPLRPGEGRRVKVTAPDGKTVVGIIHLEVGDERIVMMPDGKLRVFASRDTAPAADDFAPATPEEISQALAAEFPKFKLKKTRNYVYVYNSSDEFFTGTSSILESMFPGVQQWFRRLGLQVHEPLAPLVVIMFRTREDFDALHKMPADVAAYYDAVSNHVVLYEQTDLVDLAPELALRQAISTIAHEGVHQILHNNGVQQRLSRWPVWISEGLPEYLAPTAIDVTSIRRTLRWKGAGTVNDLRMYELDRLLKNDTDAAGDLVSGPISARKLDSTGYAASWALTHFLALKHKAKLARYLQAVSEIGPLQERSAVGGIPSSDSSIPAFDDFFAEDHEKLSRELLQHLRKLPYKDPVMNQTFYVVTMTVRQSTGTRVSAGLTTSPGSVRQWQKESREKLPDMLRPFTSFTVQTYPNKAMAEAQVNRILGRR
jgi:hypothetical protein